MPENFIIVENVNEQDIENILMDIANDYSDTTNCVNGIQLYRKKGKPTSFLILFTIPPDFVRFNYFVNYIKYPIGFENFSPYVRGYYKTCDIKENGDFKAGEWIMVYISQFDNEYDSVNLVNIKNENYLCEFDLKIKRLNNQEERFDMILYNLEDYHHIIDIFPNEETDKMKAKPWWKFW